MNLHVDIRKHLEHFELSARFKCTSGTLTAVVGPSGAGKTTLVRIIAGLEKPDHGLISLGGNVWHDAKTGEFTPVRKRRIGLVFQDFALFPHLSIRDNVLFGAPDSAQLESLLKSFGIDHLRDKRPAQISGGERQRAAFCQALARKPDLLLLDEPFSALDVASRSFLRDMLAELKRSLNIPILHVTHDLHEAELLGDDIIALERGTIAPEWFQIHFQQQVPTPSQTLAASL